MSDQRVTIVHGRHAVDMLRERGVSLHHGIKELVDNGIDWGSLELHVHLKLVDDRMTLIVADRASGVVDWVLPADDGGATSARPVGAEEPGAVDGLEWAMRIGGTIRRVRHGSGRFGFGLPQTVLALRGDATVHSQTLGGPMRAIELRSDHVVRPNIVNPTQAASTRPRDARAVPPSDAAPARLGTPGQGHRGVH